MPDFALVQAAARTTVGTQDFTVAGFGTPKAALFIVTYALTNGTAAAHGHLTVGATDGTRSRSTVAISENGVATSNDSRYFSTSQAIYILTPAGGTDGIAAFDSWVTDGVRLNWTDAPAGAYLVTCLLIGGTGVSDAYVNHYATPATINTGTDVTGPGFQPDVVFSFGANTTADDTSTATHVINIGAVQRGGSNPHTQRALGQTAFDATGAGQASLILDTTSSQKYSAVSVAPSTEVEIQDFDSSGFSAFTRVVGLATSAAYLALKLSNRSVKVMSVSTPTAPGPAAVSSVGFKPGLVLFALGSITAEDTLVWNTEDVEAVGIGLFTESASFSNAVYIENGADPTDTDSLTDNVAIHLYKDNTTFIKATLTTMDTEGYTLNYSTVDGTARRGFIMAIQSEPAAAPAGAGPPTMRIQRIITGRGRPGVGSINLGL